jgi:hypothetical protein
MTCDTSVLAVASTNPAIPPAIPVQNHLRYPIPALRETTRETCAKPDRVWPSRPALPAAARYPPHSRLGHSGNYILIINIYIYNACKILTDMANYDTVNQHRGKGSTGNVR